MQSQQKTWRRTFLFMNVGSHCINVHIVLSKQGLKALEHMSEWKCLWQCSVQGLSNSLMSLIGLGRLRMNLVMNTQSSRRSFFSVGPAVSLTIESEQCMQHSSIEKQLWMLLSQKFASSWICLSVVAHRGTPFLLNILQCVVSRLQQLCVSHIKNARSKGSVLTLNSTIFEGNLRRQQKGWMAVVRIN